LDLCLLKKKAALGGPKLGGNAPMTSARSQ
jgi:hypothetical protein